MLSCSFAFLLATSPCPAALCLLCISFLPCCFVAVHTFNTDFNVLFPQKLFSLLILVFFFSLHLFSPLFLIQPPLLSVSQDDRLRTPLLKLKLAVCSVMPEQIAKYNMDCMAKVAK